MEIKLKWIHVACLAILPCVNDFGQVPQAQIDSISSPYIYARLFGLKLAHMHRLELWESNYYQ
jgi:hypothetical protein